MTECPVNVYTLESPLRQPTRFVRAMMADLSASRELARRLLIRDLNARYLQ
jgi:lipopolysaccharide transport system permease protein